MFHKQNIPATAPSGVENKSENNETTKEENTMSDTQQENTFSSSNPFQRPVTQGTAYGTAETTTSSDGRKLIIGKGITMSGEIENCDQLLVEGTVEATLNGAKLLDIAESGVFYGSVDIEEAIIAGRFEGDLTVDGRVTITATGTVTGTITYRELTVEAGANIEGKISSFASTANKTDTATADFSKLKAASKKSVSPKKADAA
ncbi:MAG: cell shape determination protein CcmA [Alphaproteobacteria bacterium]|nr:MAG: cell shape determination protein CcmA [Alphaproteobacteria bacterium]